MRFDYLFPHSNPLICRGQSVIVIDLANIKNIHLDLDLDKPAYKQTDPQTNKCTALSLIMPDVHQCVQGL